MFGTAYGLSSVVLYSVTVITMPGKMRTLFYRLCHLLRLHLHVIFVFDGINRAETKRGKKVKKTPHWLEEAFIEMLTLFGRGLASFWKRRFGWSPEMVHTKFESVLWEGACLRMLRHGLYCICPELNFCTVQTQTRYPLWC
jgi:hypothetical protein